MAVSVERVGRNDLCPCGSGKKYKKCHEAKATSLTGWQRAGVGLLVCVLVGGLILAFVSREHEARSTGVWSPEHGHYH
jgi:hypothetical protein